MELINGLPIIASAPISDTRRIILVVRDDGRHPTQMTYITAAADRRENPFTPMVDHWDHGRYFTAQTVQQQASALETALDDFRARVTNSLA